jgi:hypothetical protein
MGSHAYTAMHAYVALRYGVESQVAGLQLIECRTTKCQHDKLSIFQVVDTTYCQNVKLLTAQWYVRAGFLKTRHLSFDDLVLLYNLTST